MHAWNTHEIHTHEMHIREMYTREVYARCSVTFLAVNTRTSNKFPDIEVTVR